MLAWCKIRWLANLKGYTLKSFGWVSICRTIRHLSVLSTSIHLCDHYFGDEGLSILPMYCKCERPSTSFKVGLSRSPFQQKWKSGSCFLLSYGVRRTSEKMFQFFTFKKILGGKIIPLRPFLEIIKIEISIFVVVSIVGRKSILSLCHWLLPPTYTVVQDPIVGGFSCSIR